jgi:hypothetical protein
LFALGEAFRNRIESSRSARLTILLAGIVLSQFILYGPSLVWLKILLPLDILARPAEYLPLTPETAKIVIHDPIQSDLVDLIEIDRQFVASELRAGRWPAWNPAQYAGKPVLQGPWLSPLSIVLSAVPSPVVLAWYQMLVALVAGVGFYLFCRGALGVGFWPAVMTAWAYPMTGFFVFWLGCPNPTPVSWLPWSLLAVDHLVRRPTLRTMAALALVTCAILCNLHLDVAGQVLLLSGVYGLWRMFGTHGKKWFGPPARKGIVFLLGGWLVGFSLAAPYVMPLAEYIESGDRATRRAAGEEERPPGHWSKLPLMVLPDAEGSTRRGSCPLSVPFQIESFSVVYAGLIATLFLAPLAWRSRRHRSFVVFSTAVVYFSIAWCLNIGGIVMLLRLPVLNLMSHNRLVLAASFAILAMAAVGLESLGERVDDAHRRWLLLPAAFVTALAGWWFYRAVHLPEPIATEIGRQIAEGKGHVWLHDGAGVAEAQKWFATVYVIGGLLATVAAGGWLLLGLLKSWRRWLTVALGATMFIDMLWFAHDRSAQTDPALYYPRVPFLDEVARKTTGRIIGAGCLPAGLAQASGLRDVRGYDGIDPARYARLLMLAAPPNSKHTSYALVQWMSPKWDKVPPGGVKLSPILDLLGVQYVIFRGSPPPDLTPPIVGPDYWALRNPSAMPRVFVPRRVETVPEEKERLAKLGSPEFDPRAVAYVEIPVAVPEAARGRAAITAEKPTEITVSVTMETPGLVVLADRWAKGWHARLNGEPVPVLIADHALRAVLVPEGTWTLKFSYEPTSFTLGLVLFGLAAAFLIGGLVLDLRRRRASMPETATASAIPAGTEASQGETSHDGRTPPE